MSKSIGCLLLLWLMLAGTLPMAGAQPGTYITQIAQPASTAWPARPVRMIVGFSAGSSSDMMARLLAPKLAELWG